jgi:hypothetical protein
MTYKELRKKELEELTVKMEQLRKAPGEHVQEIAEINEKRKEIIKELGKGG